jgi:hypothetical protein
MDLGALGLRVGSSMNEWRLAVITGRWPAEDATAADTAWRAVIASLRLRGRVPIGPPVEPAPYVTVYSPRFRRRAQLAKAPLQHRRSASRGAPLPPL